MSNPDDWPENMRNWHLRETTRDAYWAVRDAENAYERPISDMIAFTTILGLTVFFAVMERHWFGYVVASAFFLGWLIVLRYSIRERRKRFPKVRATKDRLESLKSLGGKVRL